MQSVEGKCSADIIKLHPTNASMTLKSTQCLPAKATRNRSKKLDFVLTKCAFKVGKRADYAA